MLITMAARIAQPRLSIVNPSEVKPSIVRISEPIRPLSHATRSSIAPLITKAIRPKVMM